MTTEDCEVTGSTANAEHSMIVEKLHLTSVFPSLFWSTVTNLSFHSLHVTVHLFNFLSNITSYFMKTLGEREPQKTPLTGMTNNYYDCLNVFKNYSTRYLVINLTKNNPLHFECTFTALS